jgi:prepilin-type N-terminal cleavage/methylation domain-containing protein
VRAGFTLVEVLLALAIGALVLAAAAATATATRRLALVLDARTVDGQRATAVPALLAGAAALAGRAVDGCGLEVAEGGRRLRLHGVDLGAAAAATTELFAGVDGGGRPALYLREPPFVRQPWLEEVTAFVVVAARDAGGAWRAPEHDGATRWGSLRMEVGWSDGDRRTVEVPLPHAPCAGVLP